MKAIDEFETMLKECLEAHREDNPNKEVCTVLNTIITYDLESLKEKLKEQHKEDVFDIMRFCCNNLVTWNNIEKQAEQYCQQTHEKK